MPTRIPLSQGLFATVDDEDVSSLSSFTWHAARRKHTTYAATTISGKYVLMHRFLLSAKGDELVDHRDGDGLNNTRKNLRLATQAQNASNKSARGESGIPGVRKIGGKWCAFVSPGGVEIYLGGYSTRDKAAGVAVAAAMQVFGEFVRDYGVAPDAGGLAEAIKDKRERIQRLQFEINVLGG